MKVSILAVGTRGDIQPCVALAVELQKKGVEVFIATHKEYEKLVTSNNIKYYEMPGNPAVELANKDKKENESKKNNSLEKLEEYLRKWLIKSFELCKNTDAIIYTPPFILGAHLAEKLKITYFPVVFEPSITTKMFPSPHQWISKNYGSIINKFTYSVANNLFWLSMRKRINRLRKEVLNLPALSLKNPYTKMIEDKVPYLCCFSPNLVPKPNDWYDNVEVNGYWFLESTAEITPSKELKEFLKNGKPPIFIDFGSFANKRLSKKLEHILTDLSKSNARLLIDIGKTSLDEKKLPSNSYIIRGDISHEWLLPKTKLIIMHGGVGVTHAALKAGIPSIPISILGTQHYWGEVLYKLGLSAPPLKMRKLNTGDVLTSIEYIEANTKIFGNTKEIKNKIISENGAEKVANFIINFDYP